MVVRELESNKLVFDVTLGTLSKEERKSGEQGKMRQCMHFGCLQQWITQIYSTRKESAVYKEE